MRDIPWFRPRTQRTPRQPARRLSALLDASTDAIATWEGEMLFSDFSTTLRGFVEWADDPIAPAPYRVVRGWQDL